MSEIGGIRKCFTGQAAQSHNQPPAFGVPYHQNEDAVRQERPNVEGPNPHFVMVPDTYPHNNAFAVSPRTWYVPHHPPLQVFKVNCSFFDNQHVSAQGRVVRDDRPHIPVRVQAPGSPSPGAVCWPLVDSGASINLAAASILVEVPQAHMCGQPILIHDINNNMQKTIGAFRILLTSLLSVDKWKHLAPKDAILATSSGLDKTEMVVQVAPQFSSKLLIGYRFLTENNAVVDAGRHTVQFSPTTSTPQAAVNSAYVKVNFPLMPMPCAALAPKQEVEQVTEDEDVFLMHPMKDIEFVLGDVRKFEARIMTPEGIQLVPGSTVLIESHGAPAPILLNQGLVLVKNNNLVDVLVQNSAPAEFILPATQPIVG